MYAYNECMSGRVHSFHNSTIFVGMMVRILLFVLLSVTLSTNAQDKWTLQRCVAHAQQNGISVKQAQVQSKLSELTFNQSKMTHLPTVNGNLNTSYQRGLNENPTTGTLDPNAFVAGNIGLQVQYTIFNWGARKNSINANNLFKNADSAGVDRARNDIGLLVANSFLQVMLRREQVRLSEVQLNQSRAQLTNVCKLVNAGSQPELNAIQIEAQMARDTAAMLQAKALEEQALISLKATLNLDLAAPFEIDAPAIENIPLENITELQPEAVYAIAVKEQPAQKATALRIEGATYQAKAARAAMYPSLSAFGALNSRFIGQKFPYLLDVLPNQPTGAFILDAAGNKTNVLSNRTVFGERNVNVFRQLNNFFGQQVGVSLNFPIFNQYNTRTQWERAKVNITQATLQDEQEKVNLKSNIYNAYQQAFASLQQYNASLRSVDASERAFNISQKRFDIGLLGTLDYIITQGNLFRARIESISNRYDYVFKMKVLEFYKGQGLKL